MRKEDTALKRKAQCGHQEGPRNRATTIRSPRSISTSTSTEVDLWLNALALRAACPESEAREKEAPVADLAWRKGASWEGRLAFRADHLRSPRPLAARVGRQPSARRRQHHRDRDLRLSPWPAARHGRGAFQAVRQPGAAHGCRRLHDPGAGGAGASADPAALLCRHDDAQQRPRPLRHRRRFAQRAGGRHRGARLRPGRLFDGGAARRHPGGADRPDRGGARLRHEPGSSAGSGSSSRPCCPMPFPASPISGWC